MHVYFSGIGGSGLSSMAQLCLDLGYIVSGSDMEASENTEILQSRGVQVYIGQNYQDIEQANNVDSIDWFVHSPAIKETNPEYKFCLKNNIKTTKQNQLLNFILTDKNLKLISVAGTHGKTTTTAMLVWLFNSLKLPVSWVIGSNISFGNSGEYQPAAKYLIYESDEYDRKFLDLHPAVSVISSMDFDHPDTYKDKSHYESAFSQFISQTTDLVCMWHDDYTKFKSNFETKIYHADQSEKSISEKIESIKLAGLHNRKNAFLAVSALSEILEKDFTDLAKLISDFPGTQRRMEKLATGIYSDYAHHPVEIKATLQSASELCNLYDFDGVVAVYQPHQNIRQHMLLGQYGDSFDTAKKVYWLPTYLSRENPDLSVLTPADIISQIDENDYIEVANTDSDLWQKIIQHRKNNQLILFMGAGSIDSWVRANLN
jgi:UDP-N-acetylmuramate--alanine ligase